MVLYSYLCFNRLSLKILRSLPDLLIRFFEATNVFLLSVLVRLPLLSLV